MSRKKPSNFKLANFAGTWIWGGATALISAVVLLVVIFGKPVDIYERIKDTGTVLAAILAASALAWSHFYQENSNADIRNKLDQVLQELKNKNTN